MTEQHIMWDSNKSINNNVMILKIEGIGMPQSQCLKTSCFTDGKYQFDANRHTNNKVAIVTLAFVEHNLNVCKN